MRFNPSAATSGPTSFRITPASTCGVVAATTMARIPPSEVPRMMTFDTPASFSSTATSPT